MYSAVLHSLPMLKGLDERTLTEVALALEPIQLAPNSVIYREDELADCMYFLSEGIIEMSILLLPAARKADLGLHIIPDTAVRNTMVEMDGAASDDRRQVMSYLNPQSLPQIPSGAVTQASCIEVVVPTVDAHNFGCDSSHSALSLRPTPDPAAAAPPPPSTSILCICNSQP